MTSDEWQRWLNTVNTFYGAIEGLSTIDMRPYVEVIIFDWTFCALVDTGASTNLIRRELTSYLRDRASQAHQPGDENGKCLE